MSGTGSATLPAQLSTDPSNARDERPLPEIYARARRYLAKAERVDECKNWSDKARALASYARQADDDELWRMARRVQARATRRCGELLAEFQNADRGRFGSPDEDGGPHGSGGPPTTGERPRSQREAAARAGLSKDQEVQARRVAELQEGEFERLVEGSDPPSITELANRGRHSNPPGDDRPTGPPVVQVDADIVSARGPLAGDPRGDVRRGVNAAHSIRRRMQELANALADADLALAARALHVYRIRGPYRDDARRLIEAVEGYCWLLDDAERRPPP